MGYLRPRVDLKRRMPILEWSPKWQQNMNFIRIGCDKIGKTKYNPNSYYNDLFFPSKKKSVSYLYFDARKAVIDRKNIGNVYQNRPTIQQMLEVL